MRKFFATAIALASLLSANVALAQNTADIDSGDLVRIIRVDANSNGTPGAIVGTDLFDGIGIGYGSGAGTAVTQGTSRTTTVVASAYTGAITLFSAAGSATPASFTVTNTKVAATDTIVLSQKSGTDLYNLHVTAVAAGSFRITFFTTGGTTTETPVINFTVVRGKAS